MHFKDAGGGRQATLLRTTAIIVLALVPCIGAQAQGAPQGASGGGLEDIVVTARKRAENLQNIPVAESVISGDTLQNLGISSIEKVSNVAPQLIIGRSGPGNGAAIGLRGISVNTTSISLEQSVATVIDGVYYSGGRALNEGLFDVARVEVMKGPQSLYYGKNTTAGAISVTTAEPTDTFTSMARASYEFKAQEPVLEGYVSGPLTDSLSFRFAGRYAKQYGALFENVTTPQTVVLTDVATGGTSTHTIAPAKSDQPGTEAGIMRGTLKFDPGNGFTGIVRATYNSSNIDSINASQVRIACPTGVAQSDPTAPCGRRRVIADQGVAPVVAQSNKLMGLRGGLPYGQYRSLAVNGSFDYEADKVSISLVPGYVWWRNRFLGDFDHSVNHPSPSTDGNHGSEESSLKAFSAELRAQTRFDGALNVMVGGYYQDSTLDFHQDIIFPGGLENSRVTDPSLRYLTLRKIAYTKGKTYAAFGQVMLDLSPQFNITGGARYTREDKDSLFTQPYVVPGYDAVFATGAIGAQQRFNNFSPEVTLTWKPNRNVTAYASYKTGYKSGGYSISGLLGVGQDPNEPAFAPEEVRGFEAGIKSTLMDNQLRLNLDLFNYIYSDLQVDFFNASTISYLTLNAGKVRTRGGELQAEFAPRAVAGLRLTAALGFTDARYRSFPFAPCLAGQALADGCRTGATPEGVRLFQDLTGQHTQQAPKWTGALGADYDTALGGGLRLGMGGNLRYSSSYALNPFVYDGADRFIQGQYAALDASIRLSDADKRWELAVIGKNLTNTFVASSADDSPYTGSGAGTAGAIPGDTLASINDPRTVMAQVTLRY